METTNEELITPRDVRRALATHLSRLDSGEVEKLVLMQGSEMKYVLMPVATFERLNGAE